MLAFDHAGPCCLVLNGVPTVAVAAGAGKAQSILGAARAGLVDVLVTEATTARAVIDAAEASSR
jgi:DNA-binding transcriptional regulator LsrR (DeoR family)